MKIELKHAFAADSNVNEYDVKQIKKALNHIGYYQPYEKTGITGFADAAIFAALKEFQKDYGLPATGRAMPNDRTLAALNHEIMQIPEGFYIWRTVEDDKVRGSHARFNHTLRAWSDMPDPGEEFNCRCWAEVIPDSILKGIPDKTLLDFFKTSEGNYQYMYLDTKGYVTIGIGLMLPNEEAALKLPFYTSILSQQHAATPNDIRQAYRKVKAEPFGQEREANTFDPEKEYHLDKIYISKIIGLQNLRKRLMKDVSSLRHKFKNFDDYLSSVRQALLDMEYNLGSNKFSRAKWPNLFNAIDRKDWEEAALQSHRRDVQPMRNNDIARLFRAAH